MPRTEPPATVRADGYFAQRVLLRTLAREPGEPRLNAPAGRVALGTSSLWQPAIDRGVAPRRPGGQSQTGSAFIAVDGSGNDLPQGQPEPTGRRTSDLSLPLGRAANQRVRTRFGAATSRMCPWLTG